jgi:hypothetical protein
MPLVGVWVGVMLGAGLSLTPLMSGITAFIAGYAALKFSPHIIKELKNIGRLRNSRLLSSFFAWMKRISTFALENPFKTLAIITISFTVASPGMAVAASMFGVAASRLGSDLFALNLTRQQATSAASQRAAGVSNEPNQQLQPNTYQQLQSNSYQISTEIKIETPIQKIGDQQLTEAIKPLQQAIQQVTTNLAITQINKIEQEPESRRGDDEREVDIQPLSLFGDMPGPMVANPLLTVLDNIIRDVVNIAIRASL